MQDSNSTQNPPPNRSQLPAMLFTSWAVVSFFVAGSNFWVIREIFNMEGANPAARGWTWGLLALGLWFVVAVPAIILSYWLRNSHHRAYFFTWLAALLLTAIWLFAYLPGYSRDQATSILQLGLLILFLIGFGFVTRRASPPLPPAQSTIGVAVAICIAIILTLPWVINGAYGSLLDTVLNGTLATIYGLTIGLIAKRLLLPHVLKHRHFFSAGIVLGTAVLLTLLGLAPNGNFLPLLLTLPVITWLAIPLAQLGQKEQTLDWRVIFVLVGWSAFDLLTLMDPDELNLITNLTGQADTFAWVFSAAGITSSLAIIFGAIALSQRTRLAQWKNALLGWGVAGLLTIGALVAYFTLGQVGFYGEKLYVELNTQADLSALAQISDPLARRQTAYQLLVTHANTTQAELRATLTRFKIPYTAFYLSNALEVPNNPFLRLWLQSRPEVAKILPSPNLRPLPNIPASVPGPFWKTQGEFVQNLSQIDALRVHNELGVRGAGVVLGESDSGVQWTHPELADSYRGRDGNHNYNWYDPWFHSAAPFDIGGHGTHTTGTMAGNTVGVAPDAEFIACANLMRNLGNPGDYLTCMQFMLAPWNLAGDPLLDGKPELGANVLNNSWGCPALEGCDPTALLPAVRALRAAGVFVVASAGNSGPQCSTVSDPIAIFDESFTVGAIDEDGNVTNFSSRGPVLVDGSGRIKPDILAPGNDIFSATPNDSYARFPGTSMAGPHVAGVVALMWSANPHLIGNIDLTEQILSETARPYTGEIPDSCGNTSPSNVSGYGVVDAYAAVKRALEIK
ncbi:MAG TPA: S8 family serine peptidase [Anaerolineales bacterium]|nr:S8 family serine peptidase [Anaerolineales bacterium]